MVSDYKINVIDIRQFENTEVFKSDLKQVFDFIRYSDDKEKLLDLVENDTYYRAMDEDAFEVVTKYTNSKELTMAKELLDVLNDDVIAEKTGLSLEKVKEIRAEEETVN